MKIDPLDLAKLAAVLGAAYLAYRAVRGVSDLASGAATVVGNVWDGALDLAGSVGDTVRDGFNWINPLNPEGGLRTIVRETSQSITKRLEGVPALSIEDPGYFTPGGL